MMNKTLIDSLKRLLVGGKVTDDKLKSMVEKEQIDKDDYQEITGKAYD